MRPNRYFAPGLKRMRQGADSVFRAADGFTIIRAQEDVEYTLADGEKYVGTKYMSDWLLINPEGIPVKREDYIWTLAEEAGYSPQFFEEWSGRRLENPLFRIGQAHLTRGTKFRVSDLVAEKDENYKLKNDIFTVDHIVQSSDGHTLVMCCEVDVDYGEIVYNKKVTRETPKEDIYYKYKFFDKSHIIEIIKPGCGFVKESLENREIQEPDDDYYWKDRQAFEKVQAKLREEAAGYGLKLKKSELVFRGDIQIGDYIASKFGHLYSTGQAFDQGRLVRFLMGKSVGQVKMVPLDPNKDEWENRHRVTYFVIKRKQFDKLVRRNLNRFAANWNEKLKITKARDRRDAEEMSAGW